MKRCSQGSLHPDHNATLNVEILRDIPVTSTDAAGDFASPGSAGLKSGHARVARGWIERAGACHARIPVWGSRERWLAELDEWATTDVDGFDEARAGVSITAATVLAVARVMADRADGRTGRHCAVTRATIADAIGCAGKTVSRAWQVLRAAGWVVEASRGHGGAHLPGHANRPSVHHCVGRRPTAAVRNVHLPPKGKSSVVPYVGKNSPSGGGQPPAPKISTPPAHARRKSRRCWRTTPRPLPLQRLAAAIVRTWYGLGRGHIGTICDALEAAGVDPAVWDAETVRAELNADMVRSGSTWPDRIANPGALFATRLRRIPWSERASSSRAVSLQAKAQWAQMRRECPSCAGTGWIDPTADLLARCPDCRPPTFLTGQPPVYSESDKQPAAAAVAVMDP